MYILDLGVLGSHPGRPLGGCRNVAHLGELQLVVVDEAGIATKVFVDPMTDLETDLGLEMQDALFGTVEDVVTDPKIFDLPTFGVLNDIDCRRAPTHTAPHPLGNEGMTSRL